MDTSQRWFLFWLWAVGSFCVFGSFVGCSAVTPSVSTLSAAAPVFIATSEDVPRLAALTQELDRNALQCVEAGNCEQVLFSRAMARLFENREAARASFRHVIEHNPASPLSVSSEMWLRLLRDDADREMLLSSGPLSDLLAQFVREWVDRQLSQPTNSAMSSGSIQEHPIEQSRIQGLQKQVRDRDRQIAILRGQLEALKLIDEDHQYKARRVKPPASFKAIEQYSPYTSTEGLLQSREAGHATTLSTTNWSEMSGGGDDRYSSR
jgi:hypothetical protein